MATTFELSPDIIALLRLLGAAGGGTTAGSASGTTETSPQLQASLQAIPFANDGDVITPDHHNSLRAAIAALAQGLDETRLARVVTLSFSPVLQPIASAPAVQAWRSAPGITVGPQTGGAAQGWMPLDLPNGTSIDHVTVRGKRPGTVAIWTTTLRRQELAGSGQNDVFFAEIQAAATASDNTFVANVPPTTDSLTPTQAAELRRIDTTKYRYLFHTQMAGASQGDAIELHLVQVTCTRG